VVVGMVDRLSHRHGSRHAESVRRGDIAIREVSVRDRGLPAGTQASDALRELIEWDRHSR
jgi:hypothetical protein